MGNLAWTVCVAATGFLAGLIWFVQVVHYPLLAAIPSEAFQAYEAEHIRLTTWVVAGPMLAECVAAAVLLRWRPDWYSKRLAWLGFALLALIVVSTAALFAPAHQRLVETGDLGLIPALVGWNWIRTIMWTLRFALLLIPAMLILRAGLSISAQPIDSRPNETEQT